MYFAVRWPLRSTYETVACCPACRSASVMAVGPWRTEVRRSSCNARSRPSCCTDSRFFVRSAATIWPLIILATAGSAAPACMAAHGFFAAQGCAAEACCTFAAQGLAAQGWAGLAAQGCVLAAQGWAGFAAQGCACAAVTCEAGLVAVVSNG